MPAQELTTISSCSRPGVISRIRSTRTLGSATRSPTLRAKATKRARPAPSAAPSTASGSSPPTVRRTREIARMSAWNSPCAPSPGPAASRSPDGLQSSTLGAAATTTWWCSSG